jgi:PAS domain-containing protein
VTTASAADLSRLTALIARQRRELDWTRAQAAARSVVDTAQGVLMERLGCTAAEAGHQLARLAQESGTPLAELAAEITGQPLAQAYGTTAGAVGGPDHGPDHGPGRLSLASAILQVSTGDGPADGDGIAAAALEQVLAPAGAAAVVLWLTGPDGSLELAGQAGLETREAALWGHIPPVMDCPAQRVAQGGTELLWPAGRSPLDPVPVPGPWPGGARAVLPMGGGPGAPPGVLEACWPARLPEFDRPLRRQLTALADLCGQALGTAAGAADPVGARQAAWIHGLLDSVLESALVARPLRDEAGTVIDFQVGHVSRDFRDPAGRDRCDLAGRPLLEIFPAAVLAGGLFDHAVQVLSTGEPRHLPPSILSAHGGEAAVAPVMDIRIARLFDGVVVAWRRMDEAERLASLLEHAERLGRIGGWEENLITGEIRWTESAFALFGRKPGAAIPLADLHAHVHPEDVFDVEQFRGTLLGEKRATAAAFRVIRAGDQSVRHMRVFAEPVTDAAGTLAAVRGAYQDVSAYYHTQVALTATRDRLADTEERAEEEHRLALRLQQAITPRSAEPVAVAGLDIAARYRPAGPGHLVSGDWYDTVLLPSQQVLLVVGDIAGHGIDAVTGMVALRNCLRGLAITGAGPASLMTWLNEVACHLTDNIIGTAVCGLYDPASRTLRWALAGHLPPVLVRDGTAAELSCGQDLLLGVDPSASYGEVTTSLRPGDGLLLFTDGLVERRDQPIDDALASLLSAASRPVGAIAGYADHLLDRAASDTGDDACLVAVLVR